MARYRIDLTEEAKGDLAWFSAYEQKRVVNEIKKRLSGQPMVQTRNRKELRDNPIARWELRIGKYRAFYEVDHTCGAVTVGAVGFKAHNTLYIRGEEVRL